MASGGGTDGPPLGSLELFQTMLSACQRKDVDTLRSRRSEFMLNENNLYKCVDMNGDTIMHKAIHKDTSTLKFILDNIGLDLLNYPNALGKTPLHMAVKDNIPACVELLLERKADPEIQNNVGSSPIHTAAVCGSVECLNLLMKKGNCDVNAKDAAGNTALHKCTFDGVVRVAQTIVDAGAQVNAVNNEQQTALHLAVKANKLEMVQFLIEKNADVNLADNKGMAPLHHAVSRCYQQIAAYLVSHGADINAVEQDSNTPLHIAAQNFRFDSREWEEFIFDLIRMGADIEKRNVFSKAPIDFVNRNVHWLFDPNELKKDTERKEKKQEEEAKLAADLEARRIADLAERKRLLEEKERLAREEAARRRQEEEEWKEREEEARFRAMEEEERKRLEEEEAKKRKKKKPKPKKDK